MSNSLNGKKKNSAPRVSSEVFTDIVSRVTGIYVALMLAVFPLFATDMYYNVLNDKFYFFFYSTLAAAVITLVVLLIGIAGGALRKQKDGSRPLAAYFKLSVTDWILFAFLLVVAISTFASEWVYEAFWGNVGRLQGLFFFLIVLVAWFLVTRFFRFRPFYMDLFLAAGVLVCLWGVSDYFGMDIFGWRADAKDYWGMLAFTSSIGNVNTFTAVASLYFGASAVLCLGKKKLWFYLPVFFIASLAMIAGTSDNGFLAVLGVLGLLPFYVAGDRTMIPKYVFLFALFVLAMALIGAVSSVWTYAPLQNPWSWGVFLKVSNSAYKTLFAVAGLIALLAAGLWYAGKKTAVFTSGGYSAETARIVWGALCILAVLFVGYCVYDANTKAKLAFLEPVREYLVFNDRWGTNRGYAWRSTFEFFDQFSLFKKLFGSGPETYAIFMAKNYYYEMMDFMDAVFDSPHSEPLQYLFTTGILGFLCHYSLMVLSFLKGLKTGGYAAAFAFSVAAYLCASLINISVPISTPLFFLAAALALTVKKNEEQAENAENI